VALTGINGDRQVEVVPVLHGIKQGGTLVRDDKLVHG
jgi:hypothetical protein